MTEEPSYPDPTAIQTCIVVPCYNESTRLPAAEFIHFLDSNHEVCFLFVNDGSTDATLPMLHQLCATHPGRLFCFDLNLNHGKAEAVRLGMIRAIDDLQPTFVGFWDADLATPLDAIPSFVEKLTGDEHLQMVFGARIRLLGRQVHRKLTRHYIGRLFATTVSFVLRMPIYDTQCGAKLFRSTPTLSAVLTEPFLSRWIFDVEIIARFIQAAKGDRTVVENWIFELPLMRWEDVAGSKLHPFDFLHAIGDILAIHQKYLS